MKDVRDFLSDFGVEVIAESPRESGFSSLSHCPFCNKRGKSGVKLGPENHGYYNCFSGSCRVNGNFAYIYSLLKGVDYEEAVSEIYGKKRKATDKKVRISMKSTQKANGAPTPKTLNPFFKEVEEGDWAWNYIEGRGFSKSQIKRQKLYKTSRDFKTFWDSLSDSLTPNQKRLIKLIKNKFSKFPDLDTLFEVWESENFKDLEIAYHALEASRLCARVIIPAILNKKFYGYVARSISSDMKPKTINSSGSFTSNIVGGFDNIVSSNRIVINEGYFDSLGCRDSCYLYGKNINPNNYQIKSLRLLSPDVTVIYFDVGAEEEALALWDALCLYHKKVVIVTNPRLIDLTGQEYIFKENRALFEALGGRKTQRKGVEYLHLSNRSMSALKLAKSVKENKEEAVKNLSRLKRSDRYKNEIFSLYKKVISLDIAPVLLEEICSLDYIDAGDLSLEENEKLIQNAIDTFSIDKYKKNNRLIG